MRKVPANNDCKHYNWEQRFETLSKQNILRVGNFKPNKEANKGIVENLKPKSDTRRKENMGNYMPKKVYIIVDLT